MLISSKHTTISTTSCQIYEQMSYYLYSSSNS